MYARKHLYSYQHRLFSINICGTQNSLASDFHRERINTKKFLLRSVSVIFFTLIELIIYNHSCIRTYSFMRFYKNLYVVLEKGLWITINLFLYFHCWFIKMLWIFSFPSIFLAFHFFSIVYTITSDFRFIYHTQINLIGASAIKHISFIVIWIPYLTVNEAKNYLEMLFLDLCNMFMYHFH